MNMTIRILTAVLGLLAVLAVAALWFNPNGVAESFGLTLNGAVGQATVRGDLAGLFVALGALSLLAAAYQNRNYAKIALMITTAVVVGRLINMIVGGVKSELLPPLAVELVMMAVYYGGMRMWATNKA